MADEKFEQARIEYINSWTGGPSATRLQGWEDGWTAAIASQREEVAELKAQTAAMMEKAATLVPHDDVSYAREQSRCEPQNCKRCRLEALIPTDHAAALAERDYQNDQKWIDAFGAQDLQPRVTPKSLAEWVFRDVQQQLDGLAAILKEMEGSR